MRYMQIKDRDEARVKLDLNDIESYFTSFVDDLAWSVCLALGLAAESPQLSFRSRVGRKTDWICSAGSVCRSGTSRDNKLNSLTGARKGDISRYIEVNIGSDTQERRQHVDWE